MKIDNPQINGAMKSPVITIGIISHKVAFDWDDQVDQRTTNTSDIQRIIDVISIRYENKEEERLTSIMRTHNCDIIVCVFKLFLLLSSPLFSVR